MAEHLSDETLARMVDGSAKPDERRHLEACERCREELRALREQTRALGMLPLLRPPRGDWNALEARLRDEGLLGSRGIRGAGRGGAPAPLAATPLWMRAAAALLLFVGGGVAGAAVGTGGAGPLAGGAGGGAEARFASSGGVDRGASAWTAEEAAEEVREAERRYVEALLRYREVTEAEADGGAGYDPTVRYAALDRILSASRAAVREAPTDPFLNGVLVSTLAERHATLQRISTAGDEGEWY